MKNLPTCNACRAYGVPLYGFDNLCELCYSTNERPRMGLQPGTLPIHIEHAPDKRTTRIYATAKEIEENTYIVQRLRRLAIAKRIEKEKKSAN